MTYDISPDKGDIPTKKPKTRIELTKMRTKYSTRFLNPDGSFTEEIFQKPQFYQEIGDKNWRRIVNTLKKSSKIRNRFENTGNIFKTLFAEEADVSTLFSVEKEGYTLELLLVGARKVKGVINDNEIIYTNILPQVDASYVVTNEKIKESLILTSKTGKFQYSYEIKIPAALNIKLEKDGSLSILSPINEILWVIDKPYMIDGKGVYSHDASFQLRRQGNRTFIDMILDTTFLNDPNTTYPITVDPTIQSPSSIRDTFISNRYPQNSYTSLINMFTGTTPSYGTTRSLIRFALPPLPSNSRITKASFQAYQINTNIKNTAIDLFRINTAWIDTVTWNNQPSISTASESSVASSLANAYWEWDITKLSQDWYNGLQSNYGILLKNRDESSASSYGYFAASENRAQFIPKITITYTVDPIGSEEFWHVTDEGVNPFNGNFSLLETDFVLSGRGVPLSIERTYNSRNNLEKGVFGYGWSSNLDMKLTYAESGPVVYTESDGTKHYFGESAEGEYISASGIYLELAKQTDGIFMLTLADKTTFITFNVRGRIQTISDSNGNVTAFSYNTLGQLQSIKDASNRTVSVSYGSSGLISTIAIQNRIYRYTYSTNGNLVSYTNAKAITKNYQYDAIGRLLSRKDGRNLTTTIIYDTTSKVTKVSHPITIGGEVEESTVTFSYDPNNGLTTRLDNNVQRTDYSFDPIGRITQISENSSDPINKKISTFTYNDNNEVVQIQDPKNQTYVYDYDDQGNQIFEKLPENQKAYYAYDNQNNLLTEQDYNQNIELYDYDEKNNQTEAIDPYIQSVSKRYDQVGNLLYQTNPLSVSDNFLPNSSFEFGTTWPDFWQQVVQSGKTAQFAWATMNKFGNRSVSISNPTGWAIIHQIIKNFSVQDNYVLSGYVKTLGTTGKAYLKVEYFDASNIWLGQRSSYGLTGTHDWTRLQTVITNIPAGTVTIRVSAAMDAGQGTAYFDALQFEKGNVVSAYNLIENSSFERYSSTTDKIPLQWTSSGNLTSADGRDQNLSSTDFKIYVGNYSFKLAGEKGKNKYLAQKVRVSGDASTKLTLSGWSYQEGADPNGGYYLLQIAVNYTDGTVDWRFGNDFSTSMSGWQHISVKVEPTKAFQSIDVYLYFYNQTGSAWFDALRLEIAPSHTFYYYDEGQNYVTKIEDPLGNNVNYAYDFFGNRTMTMDGNNNKTVYTFNDANELTAVMDAIGNTTSYLYDGEGNLTEVTNVKGNKKKYEYNELNQLVKWTDSLNHSTYFDVDKFGNQTRVVNSDNTIVSNVYDNLNRLKSISYNNDKQFELEYDLNDNITKITNLSGPISSFSYDQNNRLVTESEGMNTTSYSYDDNSNITGLIIQGGSKKSFIYNSLNLVRSITQNNSAIANYIYNESGQVLSIYFTNGTYASFEYNGANQLVVLTNYNVNGIVMERFYYTYSQNDNITSVQTTKGAMNYRYDQLDQLVQETLLDGTIIAYEYDSVGNRTKKTVTKDSNTTVTTYSYNQADQLIKENNQSYLYDLNGNLVDNRRNIFVYNADNRLIEVKEKITGNTIASYTYDFQGRRKTMKTSSGIVIFHYDQKDNVIYETNQSGTVLVEYTWDNENRPVTMLKDGIIYYYHLNGHEDVLELTDKDGVIVASYMYDAWGNILSQSGPMASLNPYRYAGYRYDQEISLYYLMARYYDAATGRFITQDTFFGLENEPLSLNLYIYTKSNPLKSVDPEGKNPILAFAIGGAMNSAPLLISYYAKYKSLKGFNWGRFGNAFIVGGITGLLGGVFYNALRKVGANLISKIVSMGLYNAKASILKTVSQGKKITLTNVALNFTSGGALKGTNILTRAWQIFRKKGLSGLKKFVAKIT